MQLNALTLMIPSALALIFAGVFLAGASMHFRSEPALKWWAGGHGINGVGLAVLTVGIAIQNTPVLIVGSGLTTVSPALILGGARRFLGRNTPPVILGAGLALWLALVLAPLGINNERWSIFVTFVTWSAYLGAAIWCLRGVSGETYSAHRPLMVMLGVHSALYLTGSYQVLAGTFPYGQAPLLNSVFGLIHFETILFTMGTTMFMLLICKERIDRQYRQATNFDVLTGALNRRIFCDSAQRLLERCRRQDSPLSMILFDLDHFKRINDQYGHLGGDQILRSFADTVRNALRPDDLFGRYGGEEFMVVLADTPVESACFIAERIRTNFAKQNRFHEGKPINATVSAGVTGDQGEAELDSVIRLADEALYLAKNGGRNRVERAAEPVPEDTRRAAKIA